MLFLDLDRFKRVNDQYGHLVGSNVLRRLSEVLLDCVRQVDTLARYGGDEFTILLVDTAAARRRAGGRAHPAHGRRDALRGHGRRADPAHDQHRRRDLPGPQPATARACSTSPTRRCTGPSRRAATASARRRSSSRTRSRRAGDPLSGIALTPLRWPPWLQTQAGPDARDRRRRREWRTGGAVSRPRRRLVCDDRARVPVLALDPRPLHHFAGRRSDQARSRHQRHAVRNPARRCVRRRVLGVRPGGRRTRRPLQSALDHLRGCVGVVAGHGRMRDGAELLAPAGRARRRGEWRSGTQSRAPLR